MEFSHLWTPVSGGMMHARVHPRRERAPAVVLIHGLVIASRYMMPTAKRLAPLCRVYAVDLPGYGLSWKPPTVLTLPQLADALAAWMDAVGLPRAHLIANSFGCQVLAEYAIRHADRVDRLVLQGPTVDSEARTLRQQAGRLLVNSTRERPGLGWITLTDYATAGLRRAKATVAMALRDRIEEKLSKIQAPALVVRGDRDPLVPQRWAEAVTRLLPRGELTIVRGHAHTINYTAASEFVAAMRPFLKL